MDGFPGVVTSDEELRRLYPPPSELVSRKEVDRLDAGARDFIARSPFALLASSGEGGRCDVTPRGGLPGFVSVLDEKRLAIPDATGNRRIDTMRNILRNGHAGLIFLIPGLDQTLRVNGRAYVTTDPELLASLAPNGKPPPSAIGVEVEEVFVHCPKAFLRSSLWSPDGWPEELPNVAGILKAHAGGLSLEEAEAALNS